MRPSRTQIATIGLWLGWLAGVAPGAAQEGDRDLLVIFKPTISEEDAFGFLAGLGMSAEIEAVRFEPVVTAVPFLKRPAPEVVRRLHATSAAVVGVEIVDGPQAEAPTAVYWLRVHFDCATTVAQARRTIRRVVGEEVNVVTKQPNQIHLRVREADVPHVRRQFAASKLIAGVLDVPIP